MAAIYARFQQHGVWQYQKVGRGRPPKDAKFHIRYTDSTGKRRWSKPYDTPQEAQQNVANVKAATEAAAHGLTITDYRDVTNAGLTSVRIAVDNFLRLHRNDRPKTISQYKNALTHLLNNLPRGVRSVRELAVRDALDTYVENLQKAGYANKTIATRMGIIFSMLKDNRKETGVEFPSSLVSLPEPVQARPRAYSPDEITKLFSVMTDDEKTRYLFFLHTGCREQEVAFATWDDVDFRQRKVHVTGNGKHDVGFVPKNHEERWIPLTTELHDRLRAKKTQTKSRWIFANNDSRPEGHFLRKFKAIAKKAGLNCGECKTTITDGKYHLRKQIEVTCETRPVCEKHYLHRLRKTCATRWLRSGINLMDIKTWLGHESLTTTQIYLADSEHIDDRMQSRIDDAGKF